jgi:hypothetical protein
MDVASSASAACEPTANSVAISVAGNSLLVAYPVVFIVFSVYVLYTGCPGWLARTASCYESVEKLTLTHINPGVFPQRPPDRPGSDSRQIKFIPFQRVGGGCPEYRRGLCWIQAGATRRQ